MLTNSCIASGHFAADSHELIAAVYVITFASMPGIKSSPPEAQRNLVLGQNFTLTISLQPRPQAKLPIPNYPVVTRCYLLANKAVKSHYCHGMPRGAKAQATRIFLHPVPTLSSETQEYWPMQNMKYRFEDLPLLVNLGTWGMTFLLLPDALSASFPQTRCIFPRDLPTSVKQAPIAHTWHMHWLQRYPPQRLPPNARFGDVEVDTLTAAKANLSHMHQ